MSILFIGGSRRKESINAKLKHRLVQVAEKHTFDFELLDADALDAPIYHGDALRPGAHIAGPAIIEEPTTTLVVYPGMAARLSTANNYLLEISDA